MLRFIIGWEEFMWKSSVDTEVSVDKLMKLNRCDQTSRMRAPHGIIIIALLLMAMACFGGAGAFAEEKSKSEKDYISKENIQKIEQMILEKTNAEREKRGIKSLKSSPALQSLAQQHTRDMCSTQILKHESDSFPKGRRKLEERRELVNVRLIGENIAFRTFDTIDKWARQIMQGWMASKGHRKNILNPKFQYIGVGVVPCSKRLVYTTQVFAGSAGKHE